MPIDFHTHILPGIDDGSRNVEMSLRMLAAQREQQVDEIVATPHFYAQKDSVEEFLLRRQCSYEKLKTKMAETNLDQKLHLAAEVYYFQGIGSAGMIPKLCVEGTQTLLLEMPFAQWDSAIYAVHGSTAAEVIVARADHNKEHMGLKSWKNAPDGKIVKTDVSIAKNYLEKEELAELNEIVTMYLDYATRQARRHIPMTMEDWKTKLDAFLRFNDAEVLQDKGKVTAAIAKEFAESEFEKYRVIQDSLYESDFDKLMNDMEKDDAIH